MIVRFYDNNSPWLLFEQTNNEKTLQEISFCENFIKDKDVKSILDIGCGNARHIKELSNLFPGSQYTGIEKSAYMAKKAVLNIKKCHSQIEIINKDFIDYNPMKSFNVILSLRSTLGYLKGKNDRRIIEKIFSLLNSDGIAIVDVTNRNNVINNDFQDSNSFKKTNEHYTIEGKYSIKENVREEYFTLNNDKSQTWYLEQFLYNYQEFYDLIKSVGFNIIAKYGDYDFSDFQHISPRIIMILSKEERISKYNIV